MLRSMLTLLGAAVATFAVVGWFLGWYQIRTTPGPEGHRQVNIDFNAPKITEDLSKSKAKIANMLQQHPAPTVAAPTAPVGPGSPLPIPAVSVQDIQPASGTVIVRPGLPTAPLPVPQGNTWNYPQD